MCISPQFFGGKKNKNNELKNQLTRIKEHFHSQLGCLPEQPYKVIVLAPETQVSQTTENCDITNSTSPPQPPILLVPVSMNSVTGNNVLLSKSMGKHFHSLESDRYLGVRGKEGDVCVCGVDLLFFFPRKD